MTIDQRRSALNAIRDQLYDEVQFARHKAESAASEGRMDVNGLMAHWQIKQGQLDALDDAIERTSEKEHNDNRVEVTRHTLIAATILYLLVMIPVLYLLFAANVGH